jgi:hypothetical protein
MVTNIPVLKPFASIISLEKEYERWQTTEDILDYLKRIAKTPRKQYEAQNILARFLLRLAQGPFDRIDPVYAKPKDSKLVVQAYDDFRREMAEKRIAWGKYGYRVVSKVQAMIREFLDLYPFPQGDVFNIKFRGNGEDTTIVYFDFSMRFAEERLEAYYDIGVNPKEIVAMAMRYHSVLSYSSQHWNIPRKIFKSAYDASMGDVIEGFSSPINSQLLLVTEAGVKPKFCSLFPDTDAVFGSLGDFFALDLSQVEGMLMFDNPPYIIELMDKVSEQHEYWLSKIPVSIIFVVPDWTDAKYYNISINSSYLVKERRLAKGTHYYESQDEEGNVITIKANFPSHVFLFSSMGTETEIFRPILDLF